MQRSCMLVVKYFKIISLISQLILQSESVDLNFHRYLNPIQLFISLYRFIFQRGSGDEIGLKYL
jgi:hypothetical protein